MQEKLLRDFQQSEREIDHPSDKTILRKHVILLDEIDESRKVYYTDPTTILFRLMNDVQSAIHKIYKDIPDMFSRFMNMMRRVSLNLLTRVLDKSDLKLPVPITNILEYYDSTQGKGIYMVRSVVLLHHIILLTFLFMFYFRVVMQRRNITIGAKY